MGGKTSSNLLMTEEDKTDDGTFDDNLSASDRVVALDGRSDGD